MMSGLPETISMTFSSETSESWEGLQCLKRLLESGTADSSIDRLKEMLKGSRTDQFVVAANSSFSWRICFGRVVVCNVNHVFCSSQY